MPDDELPIARDIAQRHIDDNADDDDPYEELSPDDAEWVCRGLVAAMRKVERLEHVLAAAMYAANGVISIDELAAQLATYKAGTP
jgi:hypothetical protein